MSALIDLDLINQIPEIKKNQEKIIENQEKILQFLQPKYDLTKRAEVLKYLNISDSTISKYVKEGTLKEGYHYHRSLKGSKSIISFVSGAIEEFKKLKEKR